MLFIPLPKRVMQVITAPAMMAVSSEYSIAVAPSVSRISREGGFPQAGGGWRSALGRHQSHGESSRRRVDRCYASRAGLRRA